MCEQQNNVPVGDTSNAQPVVEQPLCGVSQSLKQYYLEQARLLCPAVTPESPETLRLEVLLRKTKRIINVLSHFNRSWEDGMPEIQKACLHYLATDNISRKERLLMAEKWGDWACYLVGPSRHRGFVIGILQNYHCQLHDLEQLLGGEPTPLPNLMTDETLKKI